MTSGEAKSIAESFLVTQDMKGFSVRHAETKKSIPWPNDWAVVFNVYHPQGHLMDAPIIVLVDEKTRQPRFFETL